MKEEGARAGRLMTDQRAERGWLRGAKDNDNKRPSRILPYGFDNKFFFHNAFIHTEDGAGDSWWLVMMAGV